MGYNSSNSSFYSSKSNDDQFNYQVLVMKSFTRCLEVGAKEMKVGTYEKIKDASGKISIIYTEDTRKVFIEAVKTLKNILSCSFDTLAKDKINKILEEDKNLKKHLLNIQDEKYLKLKNNNNINYIKGYFSDSFPLGELYLQGSVDNYRNILEELGQLTKRLDFFKAKTYVEGLDDEEEEVIDLDENNEKL